MQHVTNILNNLTTPISRYVAFEAVDTTGYFEKWTDEESTNVILMGRLKVIMA